MNNYLLAASRSDKFARHRRSTGTLAVSRTIAPNGNGRPPSLAVMIALRLSAYQQPAPARPLSALRC